MVDTVLIVEKDSAAPQWRDLPAAHRIVLDFSMAGEACEAPPGHHPPRGFVLGADWRALRGRFPPYAMARRFVEYLLAARPRRLLVDDLSGASLELARLAIALDLEVAVRLPAFSRVDLADRHAGRWLGGLLSAVAWLLPARAPEDEAALRQRLPTLAPSTASLPPLADVPPPPEHLGYEAYALGRRDHRLLFEMQAGFADRFDGCARVLDIGCGTGVFMDLLLRRGIASIGVERNAMSARFARSLGLTVLNEEALDYLDASAEVFDGVYCSHFIEHLPVPAAERLVHGVARVLAPNGVAVFVFPDPESIRSQLLGFWRDPEHVRFYHPELVELLARAAGLELVASSQQVPGRRVVPFAMAPSFPARPRSAAGGLRARALRRLGIASIAELAAERARADALEATLRQLWAVNQTWAWDDNALLCFRKPA